LIAVRILNGCTCLDVLGCNIPRGDVNSCFWRVLFFCAVYVGGRSWNRGFVWCKQSLCL